MGYTNPMPFPFGAFDPDPRSRFLEQDPVPTLELLLDAAATAAIDGENRPTVRATLVENGLSLIHI